MSRWADPRGNALLVPGNDGDGEAPVTVRAVGCDAEPGATAPRHYQGGQSLAGVLQEMIGRRTLRKKMTFPREGESGAQGGGEGTAEVGNIYLVALWVLLRGDLRDWKCVCIALEGPHVGIVLTLVLLNLAW